MINITESERIEVAKCEQFITPSYLIAWNSAIISVDLKHMFRLNFFLEHEFIILQAIIHGLLTQNGSVSDLLCPIKECRNKITKMNMQI